MNMKTSLELAILRQLPYFVAVAEELNFQRASERLALAQSALSRRIRDLERDLGEVPLFVRHARGVRLTPSGEVLLEDARKILALAEQAALRAGQAMQGEEGSLRIAYSPGAILRSFVGDLFKAIDAAFPKLRLETSLAPVEQLLAGLRDRSFLVGLLYIDDIDPSFASMTIAEEEFFLALPVSHRLAGASEIMLVDLLDEPFIWYPKSHVTAIRRQLERELERHGVKLRVVMESPSAEATLGLVSSGLGLGFAPASTHWSQSFPGVVLRRIEDLRFSSQLKMLWLAADRSPVIGKLVDTASARVGGRSGQRET
jgi:DNA-binding transcriptional LysR family regulator